MRRGLSDLFMDSANAESEAVDSFFAEVGPSLTPMEDEFPSLSGEARGPVGREPSDFPNEVLQQDVDLLWNNLSRINRGKGKTIDAKSTQVCVPEELQPFWRALAVEAAAVTSVLDLQTPSGEWSLSRTVAYGLLMMHGGVENSAEVDGMILSAKSDNKKPHSKASVRVTVAGKGYLWKNFDQHTAHCSREAAHVFGRKLTEQNGENDNYVAFIEQCREEKPLLFNTSRAKKFVSKT